MSGGRPDAATVSAELARRIEALCTELLPCGRRKGSYWTIGGIDNAPGQSMWVHLRGAKAGHWQDAATGAFGDALDLIATCRHNGDKKAAYATALVWLRWITGTADSGRHGRVFVHSGYPAADPRERYDDHVRKRAYALRVYLEAAPALASTPAAAYLANRGIDLAELGRQPRALRHHAGLRHAETGLICAAMIAAVSGPDGGHVATHRTYLEWADGAWIKLRAGNSKLCIGEFARGSIRIWRGKSKRPLRDAPPGEPVVIGEGIETCLSVALACTEMRILCAVSLANMGSVWLPDQVRHVVLAADNDAHPVARLALQRAVERHIHAGRRVRVAHAQEGGDYNDMLCGSVR